MGGPLLSTILDSAYRLALFLNSPPASPPKPHSAETSFSVYRFVNEPPCGFQHLNSSCNHQVQACRKNTQRIVIVGKEIKEATKFAFLMYVSPELTKLCVAPVLQ